MKEPNFERMLNIIDELGLTYVPERLMRRRWGTYMQPAYFKARAKKTQADLMKEFGHLIGDPGFYPPRVRDAEVARFFKARHNLMS